MKSNLKDWILDLVIPATDTCINGETYNLVFATYGENKKTAYKNGLIYPIIDTIILDEKKPFLNLTFGEKCTNEFVPSVYVKEKLSAIEFFFSLFFFDKNYIKDLFFIYKLYHSVLAFSDLCNGRMKKKTKSYYFLVVFFVSRYLSIKYRKVIAQNVEKVYLTQYYNIRMLGLVRACNLRGVKVLDIQHGYIGMDHPAYNDILSLKSFFKPSGFCVFDEEAVAYIHNFDKKVDFEITNWKHLAISKKESIKNNNRKRVLYSLQWGTPIPPFLIEIVREYKNTDWVFRMHPLEINEREDMNELRKMNHVKLEEPGVNLVDSLFSSDVHMTWNSSLCFEAEQLGVPSLFLSDHDKVRFVTGNGQERKLIKFLSFDTYKSELDKILAQK